MEKEELEITLGIKNKVVEKYFEKQIAHLLLLISEFHLPYELNFKFLENAKDDRYSSMHYHD